MKTPQERLWEKINKNGPVPPHRPDLGQCWPWIGGVNYRGYGKFYYNGTHHNASRIAYLFHYGSFDESKYVCHHCDNPSCCRPSHLFLGTHLDNLEDCRKKGRARYAHGEKHWNSKLTNEAIKNIESKLQSDLQSHRQIAKEFGVSPSVIDGIANGKGWRHATKGVYDAMPKGGWLAGERSHFAKLSSSDIPVIRTALQAGSTAIELAHRYNVTPVSIYNIQNRKTWRHI